MTDKWRVAHRLGEGSRVCQNPGVVSLLNPTLVANGWRGHAPVESLLLCTEGCLRDWPR